MIVAESVALSYYINATDVTPSVAPAIALAVTPLLLLGLISVVASRGRIRVTVSIGDCQVCVFLFRGLLDIVENSQRGSLLT